MDTFEIYLHNQTKKVVRFESTDFMPVPTNWLTGTENAAVRDNAVDGGIKIVTVTNKGVGSQQIVYIPQFQSVVMDLEHNALSLIQILK